MTTNSLDRAIENFAAELTDAAFPIALRHGVKGSSIDLQLDLWRALTEKVKQWPKDLPLRLERSEATHGELPAEAGRWRHARQQLSTSLGRAWIGWSSDSLETAKI